LFAVRHADAVTIGWY